MVPPLLMCKQHTSDKIIQSRSYISKEMILEQIAQDFVWFKRSSLKEQQMFIFFAQNYFCIMILPVYFILTDRDIVDTLALVSNPGNFHVSLSLGTETGMYIYTFVYVRTLFKRSHLKGLYISYFLGSVLMIKQTLFGSGFTSELA